MPAPTTGAPGRWRNHLGLTLTREREGFTHIRIAYGAHGAAQPVAAKELTDEAADLLSDVLAPRIRRGLILRDKR